MRIQSKQVPGVNGMLPLKLGWFNRPTAQPSVVSIVTGLSVLGTALAKLVWVVAAINGM